MKHQFTLLALVFGNKKQPKLPPAEQPATHAHLDMVRAEMNKNLFDIYQKQEQLIESVKVIQTSMHSLVEALQQK